MECLGGDVNRMECGGRGWIGWIGLDGGGCGSGFRLGWVWV